MAKVINNSKAKLEAFEKANEILVPVPLSQPTPLINAIAELGNFTPPPPNPPTAAPAVATIPYGYPIIQAQTIESGGLPVQRLETNGLFNLISTFIKYWSQGGATKFDTAFGIAPGQGYTTGSVLYYADPTNPNNPINGWYTKLNNNVDTTALPNANWKQITGIPIPPAPPSPVQRLIFNAVGTGSTQYLVPPTGATGFFLTATAFGGNGGAGAGANSGGGGGGAGGGVNNIYFDLPTPLVQYQVQYISTTPKRFVITTPNGSLILYNGNPGNNTGQGTGGSNGQVSGIGINVPIQVLGSGQIGTASVGGNGGVSLLSNGQEVRANGGTASFLPSNAYYGGGGGGGIGVNINGGTGGNAIVIAEWVFP